MSNIVFITFPTPLSPSRTEFCGNEEDRESLTGCCNPFVIMVKASEIHKSLLPILDWYSHQSYGEVIWI